MSRCFPFPPPGYERKTTTANADSLIKENRKEKKDKKEKREKEKREGKEKKHKDRSKEKHGEKKNRKDKKKKDKDREKKKEKDKDKNRKSIEKIPEPTNKHYEEDTQKAGTSNGVNSLEGLDSKIKERAADHMVENVANRFSAKHAVMGGMVDKQRGMDPRMDKYPSVHEKRIGGMGNVLVEGAINSSFVNNVISQQRRHVDSGGMVEKGRATNANMDQCLPEIEGRTGSMGNMLVERTTSSNAVNFISNEQGRPIGRGRVPEKGKTTHTEMDRHYISNNKRNMVIGDSQEGANFNKYISAEKRKDVNIRGEVEMSNKIENYADNQIYKKEKTKEIDANVKKKERHKDKDRDKKDRSKKKDMDRIRGKCDQKEHKIIEVVKMEEASCVNSVVREDTAKFAGVDDKPKRKQINGILHENNFQPNKLPRTSPFSHLPVENGKKIEMHQVAAPCTSNLHGNVVLEKTPEINGHKINGIVHPRPTEVAAATSYADTSIINDVYVKPHPDSKYLGQILSVPKMEEFSETVDQEWLFYSDDLRRKPSGKTMDVEKPQVWSKALRIDEADVLALPYVIPY